MSAPATELAPRPNDLVGPGLRTFFRIATAWGLQADEERRLLGNPPRSTFHRWKSQNTAGSHTGDLLERISYVLGIYKALHILFPSDAQADGWIKRENSAPLFGGTTALDRMLGGQVSDLYVVRQYLDAQRGWN